MPFLPDRHIHPLGAREQLPVPPPRFTYPFHYAPHPLAVLAAEDLQAYLKIQREWEYNFGLNEEGGQGKMFGVLVVEDEHGELGFLAAFSGKIAESNHLPGFVPPVYDLLVEDGYYKTEEAELNVMNRRIEALEADPELMTRQAALEALETKSERLLTASRKELNRTKKDRKIRREAARQTLAEADFGDFLTQLAQESVSGQLAHKNMQRSFNHQLKAARESLADLTDRIDELRRTRKARSKALQHWIFSQYRFRNAEGEIKDLPTIFAETVFKNPIAGAGECAAPKLLQYAYQHNLVPVTMAEFWWGRPPDSAIRHHLNYYPACRGKCEPILGHMLIGLAVDPNPLKENLATKKKLAFIYEDDDILVVNKPADFLSVPGKLVVDSVQSRLIRQFPDATGPVIVHRLDMATSGLLLCAKTKEMHKQLQKQFLERTIKKRYVALLEGILAAEGGVIDLPLRQDVTDRPRQIVDYQLGKPALTKWEKIGQIGNNTLVNFWPVTGRTHQLRVHAAHHKGLGHPMVGDRLYGKRADRLYLHAEWIEFEHPRTGERMRVEQPANFTEKF